MELTFRNTINYFDKYVVKDIVESTGFFQDIDIPIAVGLVESVLKDGEDYKFLFAEIYGRTAAYICYGSIDGTIGGYNLYWIVTHNDYRGQGIGKMLLEETHDRIKNEGGRYLIAETSSIDKYLSTRNFYESNDYIRECGIKDFYRIGEDKLFYVKLL
jgi:ribosomal protein S18 acetylase RimI-like enzyme